MPFLKRVLNREKVLPPGTTISGSENSAIAPQLTSSDGLRSRPTVSGSPSREQSTEDDPLQWGCVHLPEGPMPYNIMGAAADKEQGATTQTINLDDDFHQAAILFCSRKDVPACWKLFYVLTGIILIIAQISAVSSLLLTVTYQRCDSPWSTCEDGRYCYNPQTVAERIGSQMANVPHRASCNPCGGAHPAKPDMLNNGASVAMMSFASYALMSLSDGGRSMALYQEHLAWENSTGATAALPDFCKQGYGLTTDECNGCLTGVGDGTRYVTRSDVIYDRLAFATFFDFVMIFLCASIVEHAIGKELREIRLCVFLIFQGIQQTKGCNWWMFILYEVQVLRQFLLCSFVVGTVPLLGVGMGLDSLQVALNALAVLFLVELDNVWYAIVFQEDQKQYLSSVELTMQKTFLKYLAKDAMINEFLVFTAIFAPLISTYLNMGTAPGFLRLFGSSPDDGVLFQAWTIYLFGSVLSNILLAIKQPEFKMKEKVQMVIGGTIYGIFHFALAGVFFSIVQSSGV